MKTYKKTDLQKKIENSITNGLGYNETIKTKSDLLGPENLESYLGLMENRKIQNYGFILPIQVFNSENEYNKEVVKSLEILFGAPFQTKNRIKKIEVGKNEEDYFLNYNNLDNNQQTQYMKKIEDMLNLLTEIQPYNKTNMLIRK